MIIDAKPKMPGVECWSRVGLFGSAPLGEGSTYAFASISDPRLQVAHATGDLDAFTAVWAEALPAAAPLLGYLASIDDLLVNHVCTVSCDTYVSGRTVLIGDAAHAMAPNLGQGANSALVDAAVLVAEVTSRTDQAAALGAYDRRRRRAVRKTQRSSERLARLAHLRGGVTRRVRDRAIAVVSRPALIDRQVRSTQQIDPSEVHARSRACTA